MKKARLSLRIFSLLLLIFLLAACATKTPRIEPPSGFATYSDREDSWAISPEGVLFRSRYEDHHPEQGLNFWSRALEKHLIDSGYSLIRTEDFSSPLGDGVLFEWSAPFAAESWVYLTAFSLHEDQIAIVEVAGPYSHYQEYRDDIIASLKTLSP
ncbi:MAG TPA: hypothetical protein ENN41_10825 [Sediminispirochaeta sp.]|nr:hypothetical protein [Sediminispirochaeta sp.]